MGYRIRRVDQNQKSIVDQLRRLGCVVHIISEIGNGIPDLLICHPNCPKWSAVIEIKNGSLSPSYQKLTILEKKFKENWTGEYYIIKSVEEATLLMDRIVNKAANQN